MILLWGSPLDEPVAAVRGALDALNAPYTLLDPRRVLETEIELHVGATLEGTLRADAASEPLPLASVSAVYVRPADPGRVPAVERAGQDSAEHRHAIAVYEALRVFTELTDATVVSRMSAMASNSSKPLQAQLIEAQGFAVPETLLTTDPDAARAFYERHRDVVYKSVSGVRSIVASLGPEGLARLADVASCPTQFQRRVVGVDHRVHVIGEHVFATRVDSAAIDYRYAGRSGHGRPQLSAVSLSKTDADRCRALARALELPVAGIDLRLTPEGTFVCFEVNPSPAFTFYEQNGEMAAKLAGLLTTKRRATKPPQTSKSLPPAAPSAVTKSKIAVISEPLSKSERAAALKQRTATERMPGTPSKPEKKRR